MKEILRTISEREKLTYNTTYAEKRIWWKVFELQCSNALDQSRIPQEAKSFKSVISFESV